MLELVFAIATILFFVSGFFIAACVKRFSTCIGIVVCMFVLMFLVYFNPNNFYNSFHPIEVNKTTKSLDEYNFKFYKMDYKTVATLSSFSVYFNQLDFFENGVESVYVNEGGSWRGFMTKEQPSQEILEQIQQQYERIAPMVEHDVLNLPEITIETKVKIEND